MNIKKITLSVILEFILFAIILIFSIRPVENFDFWFHVKNGEYILQTKTLPFTDVFSHTAYGQSAVPYEWLFQVLLYLVYSAFGNMGVQTLVVSLALSYLFIFRQILKEIFQIPLLPRMFLVGFSFAIGYDFWVERPQSAAYVLFMAVLYLILKRVFLGKNWLWVSIPLFLIWINLHASMVLGLYLFFSFAAIAAVRFFLTRQSGYLKTARDLTIFGVINALITILPPLGIKVYQLLWLFFDKRDFITLVIGEWVPLYKLSERFYLYLAVMLLSAAAFLWALFKKPKKSNLLLFLPFIPLGLFVISGVRQTQFSIPVILLSLVPFLQTFRLQFPKIITLTLALAIYLSASIALYFYRLEATGILRGYPKQAIPFIKGNISGNMFNQYHIGGYLMYHLGPDIKTFIDGRTDMFLPQVLPEYDELVNTLYTDEQFKSHFVYLADKYRVSWAIITTERLTPIRRLARLLRNDINWQLVFFDDTSEIYVKTDGLNDAVIKEFAITTATPFAKKLYKEGQRQKARQEYQTMQGIAPSAVSLNALGFMLLEDGQFETAKQKFEEALTIDPKAAAPKMNLAELSAMDGNITSAINLYKQAIIDDPERGLAYLRLGQLILQSGGSKDEAKKIFNKGLTATPDEEILDKLKKALDILLR